MHRCRDSRLAQTLLDHIALRHTDRVLRPCAGIVWFDIGRAVDTHVIEQPGVSPRDLLAQRQLLVQHSKLGQQDGSL